MVMVKGLGREPDGDAPCESCDERIALLPAGIVPTRTRPEGGLA